MDLKQLFPNASPSFLRLHGLMAPPIRDTQFEPAPREEPLAPHQAQEGGAGRSLVIITRCGVRLLDTDNAYGGCKPIIDALRYAGLIREDDPASLQLIVRQRKVRKEETGTEIIITQIP